MSVSQLIHSSEYVISFGDCDPAGIVFYPNIFSWLDRTFHMYLRLNGGGHAEICRALDLKGIGLVSAHCDFRAPVREGDTLNVSIQSIEWSERGFVVSYSGQVSDRTAFNGTEKRALFVLRDGRMRAGDPAALRRHLDAYPTPHEANQ